MRGDGVDERVLRDLQVEIAQGKRPRGAAAGDVFIHHLVGVGIFARLDECVNAGALGGGEGFASVQGVGEVVEGKGFVFDERWSGHG